MRLPLLLTIATVAALAVATEDSSTASEDPTQSPTTPDETTTAAPQTTTTVSTPASTSTAHPPTSPPTTTPVPTSSKAPTTTTPAPTPAAEPTRGNFTVKNGDHICAYVLMKVVVSQKSIRVPYVNATLVENGSSCSNESISLHIRSVDGNDLRLKFKEDKSNFYIEEIGVSVKPNIVAEAVNLTQFSTPRGRFYKCTQASEVLLESNVEVIFSEMKYQAFIKTDKAEFVGTELECASDAHSDIVIIAIGCALAFLVVTILVAYLIARRTNRQRGYQSV